MNLENNNAAVRLSADGNDIDVDAIQNSQSVSSDTENSTESDGSVVHIVNAEKQLSISSLSQILSRRKERKMRRTMISRFTLAPHATRRTDSEFPQNKLDDH